MPCHITRGLVAGLGGSLRSIFEMCLSCIRGRRDASENIISETAPDLVCYYSSGNPGQPITCFEREGEFARKCRAYAGHDNSGRKSLMHLRCAVLTSLLLLAWPVIARTKSDVLVMTNGDRLTCEIKGLSQGVLYVGFDYIDGTTSVQWSKVARLESKQLFIVTTERGVVYTGTLDTETPAPGRPLQLQVKETPEKEVSLEMSRIVKMGETSNDFWRRFNGQINSGIIYSKGNDSIQYNINSLTAYVRERWSAQANLSSSLSSSSGSTVSTRNSLDLNSLRLLKRRDYFCSGGASFLQSSEQGIGLQTTFYGGPGHFFKNNDREVVSLLGGLAWQRIIYDQSVAAQPNQNLVAALIAAQIGVFRFNKTNLSLTASLFPVLSEPGRVRLNANASYYVKLLTNLTWNASFYGNWDNHPPPNFVGSDYGFSSGFGWTFGVSGIR